MKFGHVTPATPT